MVCFAWQSNKVFFNSPKTLAIRFNSVPGYRNQIQLQLFNLINALFHMSSRMSQFLHLPPDSPTYSSFSAPFIFPPLVPRHCMCKITGLICHLLFFFCIDSLNDLSQSPGYKYHRNADSSQFLFLLRMLLNLNLIHLMIYDVPPQTSLFFQLFRLKTFKSEIRARKPSYKY